jgi:hypothetical protein
MLCPLTRSDFPFCVVHLFPTPKRLRLRRCGHCTQELRGNVGICFLSEDAAGSVQKHLIGEEPLHVIVLLASGPFLCESY